MPSPEKFSDYLSIFAVLISSLSLYLSWRNFRRDRSHLKIKLDFKVTAVTAEITPGKI